MSASAGPDSEYGDDAFEAPAAAPSRAAAAAASHRTKAAAGDDLLAAAFDAPASRPSALASHSAGLPAKDAAKGAAPAAGKRADAASKEAAAKAFWGAYADSDDPLLCNLPKPKPEPDRPKRLKTTARLPDAAPAAAHGVKAVPNRSRFAAEAAQRGELDAVTGGSHHHRHRRAGGYMTPGTERSACQWDTPPRSQTAHAPSYHQKHPKPPARLPTLPARHPAGESDPLYLPAALSVASGRIAQPPVPKTSPVAPHPQPSFAAGRRPLHSSLRSSASGRAAEADKAWQECREEAERWLLAAAPAATARAPPPDEAPLVAAPPGRMRSKLAELEANAGVDIASGPSDATLVRAAKAVLLSQVAYRVLTGREFWEHVTQIKEGRSRASLEVAHRNFVRQVASAGGTIASYLEAVEQAIGVKCAAVCHTQLSGVESLQALDDAFPEHAPGAENLAAPERKASGAPAGLAATAPPKIAPGWIIVEELRDVPVEADDGVRTPPSDALADSPVETHHFWLCIAGTQNPDDCFRDCMFVPTALRLPYDESETRKRVREVLAGERLKVHTGFLDGAEKVFAQVKDAVLSLVTARGRPGAGGAGAPPKKVRVVLNFAGHSLGGATALLVAIFFSSWKHLNGFTDRKRAKERLRKLDGGEPFGGPASPSAGGAGDDTLVSVSLGSLSTFGAPNVFYADDHRSADFVSDVLLSGLEDGFFQFVNDRDIVPRALGAPLIKKIAHLLIKLGSFKALSSLTPENSDYLLNYRQASRDIYYMKADEGIERVSEESERAKIMNVGMLDCRPAAANDHKLGSYIAKMMRSLQRATNMRHVWTHTDPNAPEQNQQNVYARAVMEAIADKTGTASLNSTFTATMEKVFDILSEPVDEQPVELELVHQDGKDDGDASGDKDSNKFSVEDHHSSDAASVAGDGSGRARVVSPQQFAALCLWSGKVFPETVIRRVMFERSYDCVPGRGLTRAGFLAFMEDASYTDTLWVGRILGVQHPARRDAVKTFCQLERLSRYEPSADPSHPMARYPKGLPLLQPAATYPPDSTKPAPSTTAPAHHHPLLTPEARRVAAAIFTHYALPRGHAAPATFATQSHPDADARFLGADVGAAVDDAVAAASSVSSDPNEDPAMCVKFECLSHFLAKVEILDNHRVPSRAFARGWARAVVAELRGPRPEGAGAGGEEAGSAPPLGHALSSGALEAARLVSGGVAAGAAAAAGDDADLYVTEDEFVELLRRWVVDDELRVWRLFAHFGVDLDTLALPAQGVAAENIEEEPLETKPSTEAAGPEAAVSLAGIAGDLPRGFRRFLDLELSFDVDQAADAARLGLHLELLSSIHDAAAGSPPGDTAAPAARALTMACCFCEQAAASDAELAEWAAGGGEDFEPGPTAEECEEERERQIQNKTRELYTARALNKNRIAKGLAPIPKVGDADGVRNLELSNTTLKQQLRLLKAQLGEDRSGPAPRGTPADGRSFNLEHYAQQTERLVRENEALRSRIAGGLEPGAVEAKLEAAAAEVKAVDAAIEGLRLRNKAALRAQKMAARVRVGLTEDAARARLTAALVAKDKEAAAWRKALASARHDRERAEAAGQRNREELRSLPAAPAVDVSAVQLVVDDLAVKDAAVALARKELILLRHTAQSEKVKLKRETAQLADQRERLQKELDALEITLTEKEEALSFKSRATADARAKAASLPSGRLQPLAKDTKQSSSADSK